MEMIIVITLTALLVGIAIISANKEVEHRSILYGGREYEVYCNSQGNHMCGVSIYEVVRPNRKIFRTKYKDTKYFFINDYETIKEGIYAMIESLEKDERISNEYSKKWEDFANGN